METLSLESALFDIQIVNYVNAAALAWLVYDTLLTIDDEILTVWRSKWSLTKVLYLLLRYLILIFLTVNLAVNTNTGFSSAFCTQWMRVYAFDTVSLSSWLGGALLAVRIWALYGQSRHVLTLVISLYCVETIAGIIIAVITLASERAAPLVTDIPLQGCFLSLSPPKHNRLIILGWVLHVVVNAIFFLLTLHKFARTIGSHGFSMLEVQTVAPLFHLFIRDGAFYFLVILVSALYNLIIMLSLWNRPVVVVGEALLASTYAVTSSRLMLHLRISLSRHEMDRNDDIELEDRRVHWVSNSTPATPASDSSFAGLHH